MKTQIGYLMKRSVKIVSLYRIGDTLRGGLTALFFISMFVLLHATPLWATDHSGAITINTTWYAADNPHVIIGHVQVQAGVILTLEDRQYDKRKSYRLIMRDADTGIEEKSVDVIIDRAISDDFDF